MADKETEGQVEETETSTEEVKTPTAEEVEQLRSELQGKIDQMEENWKNAQRLVSKRDEENKRLRDEAADREADRELNKALIGALAEQRGEPEGEFADDVKRRQPDLVKIYQEQEIKREQARRKRHYDELSEKIDSYRKEVEGLGLTEKDEEYNIIRAFAQTEQWEKADAMIGKVKKAKAEVKSDTPKETEEERIERLAEEKARKKLEEKGLLEAETGQPAGVGKGLTLEQVKKMSPEERAERASEIAKLPLGLG